MRFVRETREWWEVMVLVVNKEVGGVYGSDDQRECVRDPTVEIQMQMHGKK